jgi:hypothetical protein
VSAEILRELALVKVHFQLRTIGLVLGLSDRDGTAIAAANGDLPVPKDCQARAEGIAQGRSQ